MIQARYFNSMYVATFVNMKPLVLLVFVQSLGSSERTEATHVIFCVVLVVPKMKTGPAGPSSDGRDKSSGYKQWLTPTEPRKGWREAVEGAPRIYVINDRPIFQQANKANE